MLINANQIDRASLSLIIQQVTSGSAFSGNVIAYVTSSGWLGPNVVSTTGNQTVTGVKQFFDSPLVPYSGGTGAAPSAKWVNDQIAAYSGNAGGSFVQSGNLISASGQLASNTAATGSLVYNILTGMSGQGVTDYATKTQLFNTGAALSKVRVTGGGTIQDANLTGLGGTQIIHSGGFIFFSGGAGGGGGGAGDSNVQVTGSSTLANANFTGNGSVTITYDGTYVRVSGTEGVGAAYSGYVDATYVHLTGAETISGNKTFATTPLIPTGATNGLEAINLNQLSGASGALAAQAGGTTNNYYITGTGLVTALSSGNVTNTFNITSGVVNAVSTGTTITNTFTTSGSIYPASSGGTINNTYNGTVNNVTNLSGITGNFVNISFFFDQYNLATGLNVIEGFVSRDFFFTGYALGAFNSGTQGIISGSIYQRNTVNTKTEITNFVFNSGAFFYASGGFSQITSGMNRVGVDILKIGTGVTGFSVGIFGVGY